MRPELGTVAEELYAALAPFHRWSIEDGETTDEEQGWPLLLFWGAIAKRWQPVEDLASDSDAGAGWSALVDIERIPDQGLPYLAQYVGKTLIAGTSPEQQRERIRSTDGMDRGTPDALEAAAKLHLTGDKRVFVNERLGGNAWHVGVVTYVDETPDPLQTFADMLEQKPWGYILQHEVVDAYGYQVLKIAFDDYGEIKIHYPDYQGLKDNEPPAPI